LHGKAVIGGMANGASPTGSPGMRGPVEVATLSKALGESWLTIADVDGLDRRGFGATVLEEPRSACSLCGNGTS
jgi:hypothetical protein